MNTEAIGLDVPVQESYPSYIERYFTPRYAINSCSKVGEDICVLFHSNRVCVVVLAPSHPVLSQKKRVYRVNFQTSETVDRMANTVRGKAKHGAQILNKMSPLCELYCDDDTKYVVRCSVPGKLAEINKRLLRNPSLITEKPSTEGYIGIVLPKTSDCAKFKENLLTPEKYQEAIAQRSTSNSETNGNSEASEAAMEN